MTCVRMLFFCDMVFDAFFHGYFVYAPPPIEFSHMDMDMDMVCTCHVVVGLALGALTAVACGLTSFTKLEGTGRN